MKWIPAIIAAWIAVVLLRATGFGGQWESVSLTSWLALVFWVLSYAVGYFLVPNCRGNYRLAVAPKRKWFSVWIQRFSVIAIVGASLLVFEFAFRRGYGFSTPVALVRVAEVSNAIEGFSGSWVSGTARLLTPALQVAWVLAVLASGRISRKAWAALLVATTIVLLEQTMYEGGRFFLASLIVAGFATHLMRPSTNWRRERVHRVVRLQRWLLVIFLGLTSVLVFGYVFVDRAAAGGRDFATAYLAFVSSYKIDVSSAELAVLNEESGALYFVLFMFWMYITQGVNQFDQLLAHEPFVFAYGMVQFPQIGQAVTRLTGLDLRYDQFANLPNPGTYSTILGANYIDFGLPLAYLFATALGYITARSSRQLRGGRLLGIGLAAPMLVTIGLFSPIVSLVTNLWPAILWSVVLGLTAKRDVGTPSLSELSKVSTSQRSERHHANR
jgi:oligosaccharide repeat unit polymerase